MIAPESRVAQRQMGQPEDPGGKLCQHRIQDMVVRRGTMQRIAGGYKREIGIRFIDRHRLDVCANQRPHHGRKRSAE